MGNPVDFLTAGAVESPTAPGTADTEQQLAEVLADVVGVDPVPSDSNFFDDLGADSMVMARFCARVRKRADLPSVSIKDVYRNPTIASLARALAEADAAPPPAESSVPEPGEALGWAATEAANDSAEPVGGAQYVLCGALQLLAFLGYSFLVVFVLTRGAAWIDAGSGLFEVYLRSVLFGGAGFLALCTLPIAVKWLLVGRWKPQRIRVWSLGYVRFWIVRMLVQGNPLVFFAGSPLYLLYLRALGAKVGRGVVIFSRRVPVCADLLTVGDGTVIRKDSYFNCYRAHSGVIQTGTVTLGRDVLVGEATVLDIETSLGDGAQLGHTSSLHTGQAVPDGECWHGSPAQRTSVDYRAVAPTRCGTVPAGTGGIGTVPAGTGGIGTVRRAGYSALQLLAMLALEVPLAVGSVALLLTEFPRLGPFLDLGTTAFANWRFYGTALAVSGVLLVGAVLLGLVFVAVVPRVLSLAVKPDTDYRLYGFHYLVHRAITRTSNSKFLVQLFGDSSYIVRYLRGIGYDLSTVEQTGSNFGNEVKHDNPFLISVGRGTVVASGLSVVNADYSSTSFRVSRASIGSHSFLGNDIHYPARGRTGDNCLLATKVMVPVDGKVRENVGLLGSPSFEIPRTVERDARFDHLRHGDELRRRLSAKNKHNLRTMGWMLVTRWCQVFVAILTGFFTVGMYDRVGPLAIVLFGVLTLLFGIVFSALVEHAVTGFRGMRPTYCSIYQRDFWRTERFFKLAATIPPVLDGTPAKAAMWRLLGVRVGRRLFDDGCTMSEKNMVAIGDDVTLNAGSVLQCHSQEDFAFKSDRIAIGSGCTVGVGGFVHYGVTMGDGAVLAPDSFLMKGEEIPPRARWGGNPAREIRAIHGADRAALGGPCGR